LAGHSSELKEFLPLDEIPLMNDVFRPITSYGLKLWHHIFNPRQLLALGFLTRYVAERGEELILREGELGAVITLYLGFGLSKMVDFNTILTTWNFSNKSIRDTIGQYARSRKVGVNISYCEAVVPYKNLLWAFEPGVEEKSTGGGICPILHELCKQMRAVKTEVNVFQFDAKKIHMLGSEFIDVVNVDPPYFDQHVYSDFSEFFWVTLRRCLKNNFGRYLFTEKVGGIEGWKHLGWNPALPYVPRSEELIVRRGGGKKEIEKYRRNLTVFLSNTYSALKRDGKLVLWFTHKSWNAWEAILHAVYVSNFKVIGLYPFVSEHPTRSVTMHGEPKLNRTIVLVAAKHVEPVRDLSKDIFAFCSRVYRFLNNAKIFPSEKISYSERALTLTVAATARMTVVNADNKETVFEREIIPKGIVLGLLSFLRIEAKKRNKKDPIEEISKMEKNEKVMLLLKVASKTFRKLSLNLAKRICDFYGTSMYKLKERGMIAIKGKNVILNEGPVPEAFAFLEEEWF